MKSTIKNENIENIYGLSPTQEGILFHVLNAPESGLYFNQFSCTLTGNFVPKLYQNAWEIVVRRHSVLRTLFTWERRNKPLQIVRRQVRMPWEFQDWQEFSLSEQDEKLQHVLETDRNTGFDLSKAPLIRFSLFQLAPATFRFVWSFHHIILDGWSMRILFNEALSFYDAALNNQHLELPAPRPFQEYIHWLQKQDLQQAEEFWKTKLREFTTPNQIQGNGSPLKSSLAETLHAHKQVHIEIPTELSSQIDHHARQTRVTVNTIIQGAWALIIAHYSGDRDIVFGVTSSGRPPALEGMQDRVGMFINTLPIRIKLETDETSSSWFKKIQDLQIAITQVEYSPLVNVQRWSEIPNGHHFFHTILVFENHPIEAGDCPGNGELRITNVHYDERSNYPLALLVVPGSRLQFVIVYDSVQFEESMIRRIQGQLQATLASIVTNPSQKLSNVQILTKEEQKQILFARNRKITPLSYTECWHQNFEASIPKVAENTAISYREYTLRYDALNKRANQIAHYLVSSGVGPDSLVGIYMGRSTEMILGLLAILKAGGAYVPLDPMYPKERLRFMLEDTKVPWILTKKSLVQDLPKGPWKPICLDSDAAAIESYPETNVEVAIAPDNLAYVIYTSGSSGQPKGVMVTHENLQHSTMTRRQYYKEPPQRFLLFSTFAFDSSVAGIFWTLAEGGTLYIPEDDRFMETPYLADLIQGNAITHTLCVPSFYEQLLKNEGESLASLTTLILAGEACPLTLVKDHFKWLPKTSLFNEYGPTEATVWSTVFHCTPENIDSPIPIGKPLPNTEVYVLNDVLQPVAIGVPGELFLGGPCLAKGYLNQAKLTAEKFIPHPFSEKSEDRVYKTGDRVRFLADGNLEFLGRNDDQVKIRGYRIELNEISNQMRNHPHVDQALVILENKQGENNAPETKDPIEHDEYSKLEQHLSLLDQGTIETMLTEIENLSESEIVQKLGQEKEREIPTASNGRIPENEPTLEEPVSYSRNRSEKEFEIQLNLKSNTFITPPRKTQKDWLITQLMNEIADDLVNLDAVTKKFVPGCEMKDRGYIDDVSHEELSDQVILEDWQIPIMQTMATQVTENHGDILEIGFGRGVSATFIQEAGVRSHTIIECNQFSIENHFEPWRKQYPENDITLIQGRWEDVEQDLGLFDGVFFHAFPLNDDEFITKVVNQITFAEHFFPVAAKHLRAGGIFTYLTTEINSLSRRHQRALLQHFSSLTIRVQNLTIPKDTKDAWWADQMVIIKAVK